MKRIIIAIILLALPISALAEVTPAFSNQAKLDYLTTLAGHTLKVALYTQAAATLSASTTAYTTTGEISGTGYTAGGATLTGCSATLSGSKAQLTCASPSWSSSSITADAAMVYDTTNSNRCLGTFTFTSATSTNGTFTVSVPPDVLFIQ